MIDKTLYPFRLIIAGGREFRDRELLYTEVQNFIKEQVPIPKFSQILCVSGHHHSGADKFGEDWAKKWNIPIQPFPADWTKHGKAAGPIRNMEMAEYATHLIAFWNGQTRKSGTYDMICNARLHNLIVKIIPYET